MVITGEHGEACNEVSHIIVGGHGQPYLTRRTAWPRSRMHMQNRCATDAELSACDCTRPRRLACISTRNRRDGCKTVTTAEIHAQYAKKRDVYLRPGRQRLLPLRGSYKLIIGLPLTRSPWALQRFDPLHTNDHSESRSDSWLS